MTGCGDPDTQQVRTQRTSLIYEGLNVGDGFNPSFPSLIPAEAADCFAENVATVPLEGDNRYYAFYAFSPDEARSKFIELARPQNEDITLPDTLHDLMSNIADGDTPHLILAIQVDTHKDVMDSSLEASLCSNFGANLEEFVEYCGTQYLHDQTYGGYIFLAAPITSNVMDNEQYDEINNLIHPYIQKHGKSAADALADIAAVTSSNFEFSWSVWGLPEPKDPVITTADWLKYEDEAEYSVNYGYNEVIHQGFKQFTAGLLSTCGVDSDPSIREALDCYREFHDITNNPQGNPQIAAIQDHMGWVLNSPDNVRLTWSDPVNDPQEWQSLYDSVTECLSPDPNVSYVSDSKDDCDAAMYGGINYLNLVCLYCQVDPKCDPTLLNNAYQALPQPVVTPVTTWTPLPRPSPIPEPMPFTVGHDSTKTMLSYADNLCVLAGMQGKMAGGGEAARVGWSSGDWYVSSDSGQNAASNKMTVHAMCANRKWFTTNGTAATLWAPETDTALSTGSGGNYDTPLNIGAYAAALSGISGKMDSESEVAQVNVAGSAGAYTELQVIANNYLQGRATTFGVAHNASLLPLVPSPASQNADSNSTDPNSSDNWLDSYMHKVKLASTDDTFCYLTRIQGRFDGNGEGVRLITEGNYWYLQAKAGCGQRDSSGLWSGVYVCNDWKRVQATARCYRYDQN